MSVSQEHAGTEAVVSPSLPVGQGHGHHQRGRGEVRVGGRDLGIRIGRAADAEGLAGLAAIGPGKGLTPRPGRGIVEV